MRRNIEGWLIVIGVAVSILTVYGCIQFRAKPEDIIKIAAAGFAIIFFAYKLFTEMAVYQFEH